jgi:predicted HTH domain antitoxin
MLTNVCFNIDHSIFLSLKVEKEYFVKDMLFFYALTLYRNNKLSLGKAAELAGYDRLDFIQRLKAENEPIFDDDLETVSNMIADAQYTLDLIKSS